MRAAVSEQRVYFKVLNQAHCACALLVERQHKPTNKNKGDKYWKIYFQK